MWQFVLGHNRESMLQTLEDLLLPPIAATKQQDSRPLATCQCQQPRVIEVGGQDDRALLSARRSMVASWALSKPLCAAWTASCPLSLSHCANTGDSGISTRNLIETVPESPLPLDTPRSAVPLRCLHFRDRGRPSEWIPWSHRRRAARAGVKPETADPGCRVCLYTRVDQRKFVRTSNRNLPCHHLAFEPVRQRRELARPTPDFPPGRKSAASSGSRIRLCDVVGADHRSGFPRTRPRFARVFSVQAARPPAATSDQLSVHARRRASHHSAFRRVTGMPHTFLNRAMRACSSFFTIRVAANRSGRAGGRAAAPGPVLLQRRGQSHGPAGYSIRRPRSSDLPPSPS